MICRYLLYHQPIQSINQSTNQFNIFQSEAFTLKNKIIFIALQHNNYYFLTDHFMGSRTNLLLPKSILKIKYLK